MMRSSPVDSFVQGEIAATNGNMYGSLVNALPRYPIPDAPMPLGEGKSLLDVGCNWGRWAIASARKGYRVVGIDPSLDAILAAQRVTRQLGASASFVVGDARFLPFSDESFDTVFSYSVLQHFSMSDARQTVRDFGRILNRGGRAMIQMANARGLRSRYHLRQRGARAPRDFEVRYWSPTAMHEVFEGLIGPTKLRSDGFLNLDPQLRDLDLLPAKYKAVVLLSAGLSFVSRVVPGLSLLADSIYIESIRSR